MRQSDGMVIFSGEDETVSVDCPCGSRWDEGIWTGSAWVTRCPKCNRGYRTEIILWVYNPDEQDPAYLNKEDWDARLEEDTRELEKRKKEMKNE